MFVIFCIFFLFFLMIRRLPGSTRTDTLFPDTTLFRSPAGLERLARACPKAPGQSRGQAPAYTFVKLLVRGQPCQLPGSVCSIAVGRHRRRNHRPARGIDRDPALV